MQELGSNTTAATVRRRRPHYIAGTFYLLIAIFGVVFGVSQQPSLLIGAAIAGLYSVYLFRGGRFVIWIW